MKLHANMWGLSNKALLFELVSPAFRGPFAFAEKPQAFLSRIVISLFHCTEFTVFGISKQRFQGHGWADALLGNAPFRGPTAGLSRPFRENPCFCVMHCHVYILMLCTLYVISLGWHMSFAVLSPAFRGLQFPFRDMYVLTFHLNSFTGNNGRPSCKYDTLTPPKKHGTFKIRKEHHLPHPNVKFKQLPFAFVLGKKQ